MKALKKLALTLCCLPLFLAAPLITNAADNVIVDVGCAAGTIPMSDGNSHWTCVAPGSITGIKGDPGPRGEIGPAGPPGQSAIGLCPDDHIMLGNGTCIQYNCPAGSELHLGSDPGEISTCIAGCGKALEVFFEAITAQGDIDLNACVVANDGTQNIVTLGQAPNVLSFRIDSQACLNEVIASKENGEPTFANCDFTAPPDNNTCGKSVLTAIEAAFAMGGICTNYSVDSTHLNLVIVDGLNSSLLTLNIDADGIAPDGIYPSDTELLRVEELPTDQAQACLTYVIDNAGLAAQCP